MKEEEIYNMGLSIAFNVINMINKNAVNRPEELNRLTIDYTLKSIEIIHQENN